MDFRGDVGLQGRPREVGYQRVAAPLFPRSEHSEPGKNGMSDLWIDQLHCTVVVRTYSRWNVAVQQYVRKWNVNVQYEAGFEKRAVLPSQALFAVFFVTFSI